MNRKENQTILLLKKTKSLDEVIAFPLFLFVLLYLSFLLKESILFGKEE